MTDDQSQADEQSQAGEAADQQDPAPAPPAPAEGGRGRRRVVQGTVISDKMDKTITVRQDRTVKHPMYGKYIRRSTKYKAHDEGNQAREGDLVEITFCRPMSKTKSWRLVRVIRGARGATHVPSSEGLSAEEAPE